MKTYLNLYLVAMTNLKVVADKGDFSERGEKAFAKALNRTNRLHQKTKREEEIYELTPDAEAFLSFAVQLKDVS